MTHTKQFIEDAIEGGWNPRNYKIKFIKVIKNHFNEPHVLFEADTHSISLAVPEILLQPQAWQAVGKTRGWTEEINEIPYNGKDQIYKQYWVQFILFVSDGKSIEKSLSAITN